MAKIELSDKQQAFVDEYCLNGHNASQAYRKAYPNCKTAWNVQGAKQVAKSNIKQAIAKIKADKKVKYKHNEEIAIDLLRTDYAYLAEQAADGNVQAIQARTAIIRELNSACGINRTNIHTNIEQPAELTDEQVQGLQAAAKQATAIRLATG